MSCQQRGAPAGRDWPADTGSEPGCGPGPRWHRPSEPRRDGNVRRRRTTTRVRPAHAVSIRAWSTAPSSRASGCVRVGWAGATRAGGAEGQATDVAMPRSSRTARVRSGRADAMRRSGSRSGGRRTRRPTGTVRHPAGGRRRTPAAGGRPGPGRRVGHDLDPEARRHRGHESVVQLPRTVHARQQDHTHAISTRSHSPPDRRARFPCTCRACRGRCRAWS